MRKVIVAGIILIFGCTTETPQTNDKTVVSIPQTPVLSNECVTNKEHIVFDRIIVVNDNTLGYARVRSDDSYFHPGNNDNLIGNVACGTKLHAFLPEIYRGMVDGMVESTRNPYYIIQLRDSSGNDCVGYIAGHVISELKN